MLDVPANMGDLYRLPQPVLDQLRGYLLQRFPLSLDAPARVSLFAYDNHTFVVESYRASPATVRVFVKARRLQAGGSRLRAEPCCRRPRSRRGRRPGKRHETSFVVQLPPHSYRAFAIQ